MEQSFLQLDAKEAERAVVAAGGRPFHARVVVREVFSRGLLDFDSMTSLPLELRRRLADELPLLTGHEITRSTAKDGTIKLLIGFGDATIETVYMPSTRAGEGATLCVSTQVGCAVGCPFCASGLLGLQRNLGAHEIIEQYLRGRALGPLRRSVVMGIGEPLLNYANLDRALRTIREELGLGARKTTVSTVGFPDRLDRIAPLRPRFQLAISLHSPDDVQRAELVPAMAGVSVEDVLSAGDRWFAATGREVTYEYVLLGGKNDSPGHAERLARRLRGRRATVNLIPFNPISSRGQPAGLPRFERPAPEAAARFRELLTGRGIVATVRWSRGLENDAACGQLRIATLKGPTRT